MMPKIRHADSYTATLTIYQYFSSLFPSLWRYLSFTELCLIAKLLHMFLANYFSCKISLVLDNISHYLSGVHAKILLAKLYNSISVFKQVFNICSAILCYKSGFSLWDVSWKLLFQNCITFWVFFLSEFPNVLHPLAEFPWIIEMFPEYSIWTSYAEYSGRKIS